MKILTKILYWKNNRCLRKKISLMGQGHKFALTSKIALKDSSTCCDIILGSNVWMYGFLFSQTRGKIIIGNYVKIGPGSKITAVDKITIGDYTAIAQNVTISDNNNHPVNPEFRLFMRKQSENHDSRLWKHADHAPIIIGSNVWIGDNVRIQKGVTIGDNAILAANAVITKDVPANSIAAGNPAKIVKNDIDKIPAPTSCESFNKK